MICKYVATMMLNSGQKAAVEGYVSQLCTQLRDIVDDDRSIIDAARVALVTMAEHVADEDIGGALCDSAYNLLRRAEPFIEE